MSKQQRIEPLGDRVLVQRQKAKDRTEGGLYLPEQGRDKPQLGEVLAVGPGKRLESGRLLPMNVAVGETVMFTQWAGTEVKGLDLGDGVVMMSETDILGIVR